MGILNILFRFLSLEPAHGKTTISASFPQTDNHHGASRKDHLLEFLALDVHIWLPERERVHVRSVIQVRETVIDEAVGRLVTPNGVDNVEHCCVGLQPPVVLGNPGGRFAGPLGQTSRFDVLNASCTTEGKNEKDITRESEFERTRSIQLLPPSDQRNDGRSSVR